MQNSLIDQQGLFETKEYLHSRSTDSYFGGHFVSDLWQFLWQSVKNSATRYSVFRQSSWAKSTLSREDGYDITDGSGECCLTVGSVDPAFPHGSRPLAVFIGDSVRSPAACIPLPLPTQWWVSAAFLCLCPLSEMQPGLGKPQHSAKRLAPRLTDSDGHVWVFSLNTSH